MFTLPARSRLRALALAVAIVAVAPTLVASPAEAILRTITNTSPPTVVVGSAGVPEVGSTVSANKGTWNPATGVDFAYQWLADGADITNAKATTLTVTSALLGKKLSVRVTGSGFLDTPGTATSAQTAAVQNPTVRNVTLPVVTGTPKIGNSLGAGTGTWSPAGTYAYQWLADGVAVTGATAQRITLTAAEVSKKMSVRVTATKVGYLPGTATSAQTTAVLPGTVVNTGAPSLYGLFKVGNTVGVNPGTWSPADVVWTYRWFANGVVIPNVTTKTLVLDASLLGKTLKAEVTGAKLGHTSAVGSSPTSAAVTCSAVKPTGFATTAVSYTSMKVKWTKSFCATGYVVKYRLANEPDSSAKSKVVGDVDNTAILGLLRGRSYRLTVAAIGPDGVQSSPTASILVKTRS